MTPALEALARDLDWRSHNEWPYPGPPWRVQGRAYGKGWRAACLRLGLERIEGGWWVITERTYDLAASTIDQIHRTRQRAA